MSWHPIGDPALRRDNPCEVCGVDGEHVHVIQGTRPKFDYNGRCVGDERAKMTVVRCTTHAPAAVGQAGHCLHREHAG